MKYRLVLMGMLTMLMACEHPAEKTGTKNKVPDITGTWQLVTGTTISGTDTSYTDYTKDQRMIKIINQTHFAFLRLDLNGGKDTAAAFAAGGGRYTFSGEKYTEYLDFCNFRNWEGNVFHFTLKMNGDTLVQSGIEKLETEGINRYITETYTRVESE